MKEAVGKGLKWVILCGYVFLRGVIRQSEDYEPLRRSQEDYAERGCSNTFGFIFFSNFAKIPIITCD